ncbi:hypothetical protein R5R35_002049 [Gryllus longicercus]|uniref:Uncharacterized protein n=1 Tax=Gryllus longicercus TaxID=2509291 RepID=A0AAN9Z1H8_9ORTH
MPCDDCARTPTGYILEPSGYRGGNCIHRHLRKMYRRSAEDSAGSFFACWRRPDAHHGAGAATPRIPAPPAKADARADREEWCEAPKGGVEAFFMALYSSALHVMCEHLFPRHLDRDPVNTAGFHRWDPFTLYRGGRPHLRTLIVLEANFCL